MIGYILRRWVTPAPYSWTDTDTGIVTTGEIRHIWTCTPPGGVG